MSVQQYLLDVLEDRRQDRASRLLRAFLGGLSKIYAAGLATRHFLYRYGLLRRKTLGCTIISVGNLTVGGTGKTPVVEMFAKALREGGRKVAILSRGYKRRKRWSLTGMSGLPSVVSDGQKILLESEEAGDEPYMLAKNLPGVAVLVDKNRVKSGSYAIGEMGVDTLILDDGFQYLALNRRANIVLVDATNPFSNGRLLPRGLLREPLKNLARADYVFLTKADGVDTAPIVAQIRSFHPSVPVIECRHEPKHLVELDTGAVKPLSFLKDRRVAVLIAIASPEGFEKALRTLGAQVIFASRYPDHHRFSAGEIQEVIRQMHRKRAESIITTEKDAVRFPADNGQEKKNFPTYYLRVEIAISEGIGDFNDCVAKLCR